MSMYSSVVKSLRVMWLKMWLPGHPSELPKAIGAVPASRKERAASRNPPPCLELRGIDPGLVEHRGVVPQQVADVQFQRDAVESAVEGSHRLGASARDVGVAQARGPVRQVDQPAAFGVLVHVRAAVDLHDVGRIATREGRHQRRLVGRVLETGVHHDDVGVLLVEPVDHLLNGRAAGRVGELGPEIDLRLGERPRPERRSG